MPKRYSPYCKPLLDGGMFPDMKEDPCGDYYLCEDMVSIATRSFTEEEKELFRWIYSRHEQNKGYWPKGEWEKLESLREKICSE